MHSSNALQCWIATVPHNDCINWPGESKGNIHHRGEMQAHALCWITQLHLLVVT